MSDERFWLLDPKGLMKSLNFLPTKRMSLDQQMNAFTRSLIVISLGLYLFNAPNALSFFFLSICAVIILYFVQKRMSCTRENYTGNCGYATTSKLRGISENNGATNKIPIPRYGTSIGGAIASVTPVLPQMQLDSGNINVYTIEEPSHYNDKNYVFPNQRLAQGANPITKIAPVIPVPSHDLSYWKANNLIEHSAVNKIQQRDAYLSGYANSTYCVPKAPYTSICQSIMSQKDERDSSQVGVVRENFPIEDIYNLTEKEVKKEKNKTVECVDETPGWVNTSNGYNQRQTKFGLPANLPVGNCQESPNLVDINESMFTQTIQPGVFQKFNVVEPINSNIGISFQQQFEPVTCSLDKNGVMFTQNDPYEIDAVPQQYEQGLEVNYANVYDPRFSGYGTSYRSFTEPVTGQTRYYYDDINSVRMPNYITRSKVDTIPGADTYNSLISGFNDQGNVNTANIRQIVQDKWLEDSMEFRNDMTTRLMRKRNAEMWQVKMAPKRGGRVL